MTAWRRPLAFVAGVAAGGILTAVIVIGESEARLAASGAVLGPGGFVLVDPQWATLIALALTLIGGGVGVLVWELARGRVTNLFWAAVAAPPLIVVVIGLPLAPAVFDPERRAGIDGLLAASAQSPLLLAVILAAGAAAWATRPAETPAERPDVPHDAPARR